MIEHITYSLVPNYLYSRKGGVDISNDPQVDGVKKDTLALSTLLPKLGFHDNLRGGFQTVKNIFKVSHKNTFLV